MEGEEVVISVNGERAKDDVILSSDSLYRPELNSETSIQPVAGPESGANEVAECGNRKRKIVKRMVKKKVIVKKKVPKRVLMNGSESRGLVESAEDGIISIEVPDNSNCKPVSEPIDSKKGNNPSDIDSLEMEASKNSSMARVPKPMIIEKGIDLSGNKEMETCGADIVSRVPEQLVAKKAGDQSGFHCTESTSVGFNGGQSLSGQVEALEQKKQKTEIFVGGLDKDAKEEDVRKVFEEVGTVVEVRLKMNIKKGKNKGFAFVQFATAADAKNALEKFSKVEICGKSCDAAPVQRGKDTVCIGNIDRKWRTEDVLQLLEKAGIEKIYEVTLKADPISIDKNHGLALVEFETSKDAKVAFKSLQNNKVFGKNSQIKFAWKRPSTGPSEEEILKHNSKSEQMKHATNPTGKQLLKAKPNSLLKPNSSEKPNSLRATEELHGPRDKKRPASSSRRPAKADISSSTTDELLEILRQQASSNHVPPCHSTASITPDYHFSLPRSKRPFSLVEHDPFYLAPIELMRPHFESSYPTPSPSSSSRGVSVASFPYPPQRQGHGFISESVDERSHNPGHFQTTEEAPYSGINSIYHRYR